MDNLKHKTDPSFLLDALMIQVAARTPVEGRNDTKYPGLRFYRFSTRTHYQKTQRLIPGIVVVLQASKQIRLGAKTLSYDAENYLILGAEVICQGTVVNATPLCPYLAIHLDLPPDLLVKTMLSLSDLQAQMQTDDKSEPRQDRRNLDDVQTAFVTKVDPQVLEPLLRLLLATDSELDRLTIAPLILAELMFRLLRSSAAPALREIAVIKQMARRIHQSMQYIQDGFSRKLTVNDLAQQVAISVSNYAHNFREVAGITPMRYLRDVRLAQAKVLLAGGGLRMVEVASRVGFDSVEHFTREFKRRFDVSPSEFKLREDKLV